MQSKSEFLLSAISEAQETIRSLDVKLAALLVAVLVPVPLLSPLAQCFGSVYKTWPGALSAIALAVFLMAWLSALHCFVMAIGAISNPANKIPNAHLYKGVFFAGGNFNFGLLDAYENSSKTRAAVDPAAHLANIPDTVDAILAELSFEHLKLTYIRDLKFHRMRIGFRSSGIAFACGFVIFVVGRYYTTQCGA